MIDQYRFCSLFLSSNIQEHHGLHFTDFVKGFYGAKHPTMPGIAYLELKGSIVTKGYNIKGSVPTLYGMRNAHCLVHNPNGILRPYHLYKLMCGFGHPYQEFVYRYKGNCKLLGQYSSLPDCHTFQMNPKCRMGKNSNSKLRGK
jgi:hypothetical protein